jgi:glucokinase
VPSVLGIDVGGTKVAVARVEGAEASDRVERATELSDTEALLDGIQEAVDELVGDGESPDAIGVGVPSQIEFSTGTVISSVNIPLEGVPLREELGKRFGVPVFVDNDANCAALAEAQMVPDPPATHLVMLTLGTGVGGGVVIDGQIERGRTGLGAELGHVVIDGGEALAAEAGEFPRPGSLEWHCSGRGLERAATQAARDGGGDGPLARTLADDGRVSGREAVSAAQEGDAVALEVFDGFARWLGLGIASMVNAFEPGYVVIGGGLSRAADLFLDAAVAEAERNTLPALWERTTVGLARGGADAGVIGAGVLAAQELERSGNTGEPGEPIETTSEGKR